MKSILFFLAMCIFLSQRQPNTNCLVVSGSDDGLIRIWNHTNGKKVNEIKANNAIYSFESINNSILLSGHLNGEIRVYNLSDYNRINLIKTALFHTKKVNVLKLSRFDQTYLASGSDDLNFVLWNATQESLNKIKSFGRSSPILSIEFLNESMVSYGYGSSIEILDIKTHSTLKIINDNNFYAKCLILLNNQLLLAGSKTRYLPFYNIAKNFQLERTRKISSYMTNLIQIDRNTVAFLDINGNLLKRAFTSTGNEFILFGKYLSFDKMINGLLCMSKYYQVTRKKNYFSIEIFNFNLKINHVSWNAHDKYINAVKYISENRSQYKELEDDYSMDLINETVSTVDLNNTLIDDDTTFLNDSLLLNYELPNDTQIDEYNFSSNVFTEGFSSIFPSKESYPVTDLSTFLITTKNSSTTANPNKNISSILIIAELFKKSFLTSPVINLTNIFSSFDFSNNIEDLMVNLQNRSFSFDLSSSKSSLPTSLLASPKYDISNCVSNCSNRGICKLNDVKFECQCGRDYNGTKCELDLRPCSSSPCLNYERCDDILNEIEDAYVDFNCTCKLNFYGKRCEKKIDLCKNETCSGNGLCKVLNDTIKCECFGFNSFEGEKCETKSSKTVTRQTTIKSTYYIALIILALFYLLIFMFDIHKYFIMKKANKTPRKKKGQND